MSAETGDDLRQAWNEAWATEGRVRERLARVNTELHEAEERLSAEPGDAGLREQLTLLWQQHDLFARQAWEARVQRLDIEAALDREKRPSGGGAGSDESTLTARVPKE